MKQLLITTMLLATFSALAQTDPCPFGDSKVPRMIQLDSLKNRSGKPTAYSQLDLRNLYNYQLADNFMTMCSAAVVTEGYIVEVQDGGIESCNCHSKTNRDTHIYVGLTADAPKSECVIVEVTPRYRSKFGTTADLRKQFKGHRVKIAGYLFQDEEHKQNSTVDNGKGLQWRHTTWEIHPVTDIQLVK